MDTATISVKGQASDEFTADYALVPFAVQLRAPARSEALAGANAAVAQLRETSDGLGAGVLSMRIAAVRVQEHFEYRSTQERVDAGWIALVDGHLHATPDAVSSVLAAFIRAGARVFPLTWHLHPETHAQAQRAVRRRAVADATDAAADFALALGATLGPLIHLADPGLNTGGLAGFAASRARAYGAAATAGGPDAAWDELVDIDPDVIVIHAQVEASFQVILTPASDASPS